MKPHNPFVIAILLILSIVLLNSTASAYKKKCYNRCELFKTSKGSCLEYEKKNRKKECFDWTVLGKGKCDRFKTISQCLKWRKSIPQCISKSKKLICSKEKQETICEKTGFVKVCADNSKKACDEHDYYNVCSKYEVVNKCTQFTKIPKLKCTYVKKCDKKEINPYCKKYQKVCKCNRNWHGIKGNVVDRYYKDICRWKCYHKCDDFLESKDCKAYKTHKTCKVVGYTKQCVKLQQQRICVEENKVKFCKKYKKASSKCRTLKKVKVCHKYRTIKNCTGLSNVDYCGKVKAVNICEKRKYEMKCESQSKGTALCFKYHFVGGARQCVRYGIKKVCVKKKKVCYKIVKRKLHK